jgi:UDP-glucose 4-epimerase
MPLLGGHTVLSVARSLPATPLAGDARTIAGNIGEAGPWQDEVERFAPDWCLHLAWQGIPDYSLAACRTNLDLNIAFLQTLVRTSVQRVVVTGSCWEYGRAAGPVRDDQAPVDCGIFAATKHAIRGIFESAGRERGFACLWARLFFVYGPGQRVTSLLPMLHEDFAAGRPPRVREPQAAQDFVFVDDVARGLVALAASDAPSGAFNLGSGQSTRVGEVANLVARHFHQPAPFVVPPGDAGFWADSTRVTAATGWRATTGIAEGIARTLAGMSHV